MNEIMKITPRVICPKCHKSDRIEKNKVISHVTKTVGAGAGATYAGLGAAVGSVIPVIGTTTGGLAGMFLGTIAGHETGKVIGETIETCTAHEFRCKRCKVKFKSKGVKLCLKKSPSSLEE